MGGKRREIENIRDTLWTVALVLGIALLFRIATLGNVDATPPGLVVSSIDVPLPGPPVRFDYQSLDPRTDLLYISHMDADHVVVFDTRHNRVVANIAGCPGSTGVLYVPQLDTIYSSASAAHEVVAIDAKSRRIVARVHGIRFPDGIAYAPDEKRLFVSDEAGRLDAVIDAATNSKIAAVPLGGEAGNTQYDPVSHRIFVNVQTRNEIAAIDPKTNKVVARYPLPGAEFPHGMLIDPARRIAYIACERNAKLLVVDMHRMKVVAQYGVGDDPDVLAFDPTWRRLYIACESGVVSVFDAAGKTVRPLGEIHAPRAHSVAVAPSTHRIYLPLEDVRGRPVMRIVTPVPPHA